MLPIALQGTCAEANTRALLEAVASGCFWLFECTGVCSMDLNASGAVVVCWSGWDAVRGWCRCTRLIFECKGPGKPCSRAKVREFMRRFVSLRVPRL